MNEMIFLVGSYARAGEDCVFRAALNPRQASLRVEAVSRDVQNPSWLAMHPEKPVLYAVEERVPDGGLAVFHCAPSGLQLMQRLPAGGAPCHVALDIDAEFLLVSNYMDGSIGVYRLGRDGEIIEQSDIRRHSGKGVNPLRQKGPHVHSTLFHQGRVYAADLGLDCVVNYRLDKQSGVLSEESRLPFPPGSGPRHFAAHPDHPNRLFVNTELGGTVCVLDTRQNRILQEINVFRSPIADDFTLSSIKFSGDMLYVGSRGENAIIQLPLLPDGSLDSPVVYRHQAQTPRDVWMNDAWAISADEGSSGLTLLRREGHQLIPVCFARTSGAGPTCILPMHGHCLCP